MLISYQWLEIMRDEDVVRSHVAVDNAADPAFLMEVPQPPGGADRDLLPGSPPQGLLVTA